MIKFITTDKNDFKKCFIQEFNREQVLGACRMEDARQTTEAEKNEMLDCIYYYFNNIPFKNQGRQGTRLDALYASFAVITASPLVRKWVERNEKPFGITLELDPDNNKYNIYCSSLKEWMVMNRLFQFKIDN